LGAVPEPVPPPPTFVAPQSSSRRLGVVVPAHNPMPAQQVSPELLPTLPPAQKRVREYGGPSNMRGIIGAALAGLVGMIIWTLLIIVTNHEIGYVAWGVGGLVGFGAKTFGKGE